MKYKKPYRSRTIFKFSLNFVYGIGSLSKRLIGTAADAKHREFLLFNDQRQTPRYGLMMMMMIIIIHR